MTGYYDHYPLVRRDRHLALVGFMTEHSRDVGRRVASLSGLSLLDLDRLVEHDLGRSLSQLVDESGVEAWRHHEARLLQRALDDTPGILVLGDGALLSEQNRTAVKERVDAVLLDLDLASLYWLLRRAGRPVATDSSLVLIESVEDLRPYYRSRRRSFRALETRVGCIGRTTSDVADEIVRALLGSD